MLQNNMQKSLWGRLMINNRVLWICNHATLMDVECRLLHKLGFEVFVPKVLGDNRSSTVSYEFDKSLTVPPDVLEKINKFDFYHNHWTKEIKILVNKYFDIAFCVNVYPALFNLVKSFSGKIVLRAFGYESNINYEQTTRCTPKVHGLRHLFKPREIVYDNEMMRQLYKIRDRFFLGVAYRQIIPNETPFFRQRSIFLPLGMPQSIWRKQGTWRGGGDKIMFVCPSIENPYYNNIYNDFNKNFGDLPHLIFGAQTRAYPEDKTIVGYLDRPEFDKYMQKYPVMFYHSMEPRHLHYHPLEAVCYGMPLVFMAGGILEDFGGANQPGLCHSFDEAHDKLSRILNGDKKLVNDILLHQKKILNDVSDDFVLNAWQENFTLVTKVG